VARKGGRHQRRSGPDCATSTCACVARFVCVHPEAHPPRLFCTRCGEEHRERGHRLLTLEEARALLERQRAARAETTAR
jgi:hypothetical protein